MLAANHILSKHRKGQGFRVRLGFGFGIRAAAQLGFWCQECEIFRGAMYWEFLGELWIREAERESKSRECGAFDELKRLDKRGRNKRERVHYRMTHLTWQSQGERRHVSYFRYGALPPTRQILLFKLYFFFTYKW